MSAGTQPQRATLRRMAALGLIAHSLACQWASIPAGLEVSCETDGRCPVGATCWPDGVCRYRPPDAGPECEPFSCLSMCGTIPVSFAGSNGCRGPLVCEDAGCAQPGSCGGGGVKNVCGQEVCVGADGGWCWENPRPQGYDLGSVAIAAGQRIFTTVMTESAPSEAWGTYGFNDATGWQFRRVALEASDAGRPHLEVYAHPANQAVWLAVSLGTPPVLSMLKSLDETGSRNIYTAPAPTAATVQTNRVVALHDGRALLYRSSDMGPPNETSGLLISNTAVIDAGRIGLSGVTQAVELPSGALLVISPGDADNDAWVVGTPTLTGTWTFESKNAGDFSSVGRGTVAAITSTPSGAVAALNADGATKLVAFRGTQWSLISTVLDAGTSMRAVVATDRAAWLTAANRRVLVVDFRNVEPLDCGFLGRLANSTVATGQQEALLVGNEGLMVRCHKSGGTLDLSYRGAQLEGNAPAFLVASPPSTPNGAPQLAALSCGGRLLYSTMTREPSGVWMQRPETPYDAGLCVGAALGGETLVVHEGATVAFVNWLDGGLRRTAMPAHWLNAANARAPLVAATPSGFLVASSSSTSNELIAANGTGDWLAPPSSATTDAGTLALDAPGAPDAGAINAVVPTADPGLFFIVREQGTQLVQFLDGGAVAVLPVRPLISNSDAGSSFARVGASARGSTPAMPMNYTFENIKRGATGSDVVLARPESDGGVWRSSVVGAAGGVDGLFVSGARAWTGRGRSLSEISLDNGVAAPVEDFPTRIRFRGGDGGNIPPRMWGDEMSGQVWFLGPGGSVMRKRF